MANELEKRVSKLEILTKKLGQSTSITNEVVKELIEGISDEIKGQVKEELVTREKEIESNIITTVSGTIEETVRNAVDERGLNRKEMNKLTSARNFRFRQLLGDPDSDKYILLISFYQGAMVKEYRKKFECSAYGDIDASRFKEALEFIKMFDVTQGYYNWSIEKLHTQYRDGEIEKKKKINAYERFFGIRVA
ncbi:ORF6C domain-containing protein [Enterocloster bolteae]|uniref:ORF6C domain-containing protein n=1 Tax=Enterocloster bolteae TaxID=208479 RepID=UPI002062B80A|nr:MAG TPA: hypothetical protein [Caudoviricetes sp.]